MVEEKRGGGEGEKTNQFYIGHFPSFLRLYMYIHLIAVVFFHHFYSISLSICLSFGLNECVYMFLSQNHKWCAERRKRAMLNNGVERVKGKNREKEKLKWFE